MSDDNNIITVYIPKDDADRIVICSLLDSFDMKYFAKNLGVQNLIGAGMLGGGFNLAAGQVEIQVLQSDFDIAKEIIEGNNNNM